MVVLVFILNLIGIILYIVAGGCVFMLFIGATDDEKSIVPTLILVGILSGVGGYYIRDFADNIENKNDFDKYLVDKDKQKVLWKFDKLSETEKEENIENIYNQLYSKDFESKTLFIKEYYKYNLSFVNGVLNDVNQTIDSLYSIAEKQNDIKAWRDFSYIVKGDFFIDYADEKLKTREFSKWSEESEAWNRVFLLDTIPMLKEYLKRFSDGEYRNEAKKILLDKEYQSGKFPQKITSNYDGFATVNIVNESSRSITFSYKGQFAEGEIVISENSERSINVPTGYYHLFVTALSSSSSISNETFDSYHTLSYKLSQQKRRR